MFFLVSSDFKSFANEEYKKCVNNLCYKTIKNLLSLAEYSIQQFNDLEFAMKVTKECKTLIVEKFFNSDMYDVLDYYDKMKKIGKGSEMLNLLWETILFEAKNRQFDSYLLYLEKNRDPKQRFYFPKRRCFMKIGLVQALQDMLDDKLDTLSISLPPGTGKLLADDTPVLTTKGWKTHGELVVGDYVYGLDGKPKEVQHVFPKNYADCLITFSNGENIQCHEEHEWVVYDRRENRERIIETKEFFYGDLGEYVINQPNHTTISITIIERVEKKQGNCIQVDGGIYCVGKKMIPTHNSTIEKFFHSAVCGWFPEEYSLFVSHSAGITRMYYDGVYSILNDADYTWNEIFPECKITNTNAKLEQITINDYKPFPNVQTASVGSEMAGKVRASKFLFVDDLIGKLEEALNKNTLDKLWNFYSTDALQRKTVDSNDKPCKEIHIATRWSVHDVIGRLKLELDSDPRARFIAVPDIDPDTGLSNFNYDYKGMDEEFFRKQERFMDDISYRCLYKNDPIEREGLLYTEDSIRRYITMPDREPDAIVGVCDTKTTGKDYMVLTVFYQYDNDYYLVDCICDNSADFGVQQTRLSNIIIEHNMQQCEFESNAGGSRLALQISELVQKEGGRCNITTKPTETNKETRIIVNSDWIMKNCLFKDKELYNSKSDYGQFMSFLLSYSVVGKNPYDDVPDALANFALFISDKYNVRPTVVIRGGFLR